MRAWIETLFKTPARYHVWGSLIIVILATSVISGQVADRHAKRLRIGVGGLNHLPGNCKRHRFDGRFVLVVLVEIVASKTALCRQIDPFLQPPGNAQ